MEYCEMEDLFFWLECMSIMVFVLVTAAVYVMAKEIYRIQQQRLPK